MLKNLTSLYEKIEDREYQFLCDPNAPLGELHDVLHKMKDFVVQKMVEVMEAEKTRKEAQEQKPTE